MKRKTTITNVDRLQVSNAKPTDKNTGTIDPTKQGGTKPLPTTKPIPPKQEKPEEKKKGPGVKIIQKDLPDNLIDRIEDAIKQPKSGEDWDIGETEANPTPPSSVEQEGREWTNPKQIAQAIDEAIRDGQDEAQKEERKEEKTQAEKGMGGGVGGIRDRLKIETLAKIDWAAIFKTRLSAYSREASKYLPYHRRFVGSSKLLGKKIPSRTMSKDVLPELNLVIDTSSSLSYAELEVILSEVNKALSESKIKKVNTILWTGTPYYFNSYNDVNAKTFQRIIDDIQANWQGGGNDVDKVYKLMIEKGITKKFTIHLTDGYIQDHRQGTTAKLSEEALDPNHTIFGIIYPHKRITVENFKQIAEMFPGEKIPIFLDTDKFR